MRPVIPMNSTTPKPGDLARRHKAVEADPDAETLLERPEGILAAERRAGRRVELDEDDEGPDLEPPGWARP